MIATRNSSIDASYEDISDLPALSIVDSFDLRVTDGAFWLRTFLTISAFLKLLSKVCS